MTNETANELSSEKLDLHLAIEEDEEDEEGGDSLSPEAKPRKSMRKAINEMCKSCIWDEHGVGNWKQQCSACTVTKCPLYELRPISKPKKAKVIE